jgi:hypothetical protein
MQNARRMPHWLTCYIERMQVVIECHACGRRVAERVRFSAARRNPATPRCSEPLDDPISDLFQAAGQ